MEPKLDAFKNPINIGDIIVVGGNYSSRVAVIRDISKSSIMLVDVYVRSNEIRIPDPTRVSGFRWGPDPAKPRNIISSKTYVNYSDRLIKLPDQAFVNIGDDEVIQAVMAVKHDVMAGKYKTKKKKKDA